MEKKVEFKQIFYSIESISFRYEYTQIEKEESGEDSKWMSYEKVVPVYVHSINKYWDEKEDFTISPVNPDDIQSDGYWKWRRNHKYEDIGKSIFLDEDEAVKIFNSKYNKRQRERFKELEYLSTLK